MIKDPIIRVFARAAMVSCPQVLFWEITPGKRHSSKPMVLFFYVWFWCRQFGEPMAPALDPQHSPLFQPKIFTSFPAMAGDPAMSYKDHPDMALAACSSWGAAGQVLVVTGQDVAVYDTLGLNRHLDQESWIQNRIQLAPIGPDMPTKLGDCRIQNQ